jgi:hypothetical protein
MPRDAAIHRIFACTLLFSTSLFAPGCDDDDGKGSEMDGGKLDGGPDAGNPDGGDAGGGATADTWALTSAKRLVQIERATGKVERAVALSGLPSGENVVGIDVRPSDGALYALSSAGKLYTVDRQSGALTLKSTLAADSADATGPYTALAGQTFGVDFNPVADRLRVVSNSGQNLRINVDTGATTTDTALNSAASGVTAAAYTNSFASACRTRLLVVDGTSRKFYLQDPPNDGTLTELGTLGEASGGSVRGFDIAISSGGAAVGLAVGTGSDGERISDIDVGTGALSNPRKVALDANETLEAIATLPPATAPAQTTGELIAVTAGNRVISFNRGAPGKPCTNSAITGLGSAEVVLGADLRPADGALYAVTDLGKIFTVNLTNGAATSKSTLSADGSDTSAPYTAAALTGTELGVGFNPVADRLRVITKAGINLRINVDTGATTTDEVLNPGTPAVTGVAYTNSVTGATTTTLFAIDSGSDSLVRIGADPALTVACAVANDPNPNCGDVTSIGTLGVGDVTDWNGFDIAPATPTVGFAALSIGAATQATLYTINLTTGAATLPTGVANGTIGVTDRIRSLVFAPTP